MLEPFAKASWLLELERRAHTNKHVLSKINHLIDRCFRTSSNLLIPDVSAGAYQLSTKLGINIHAAKENEKSSLERFALENGENDFFFYEHKETVSEMRRRIMNSQSYEDVLIVFENQKTVWVLNSENNRLIANGNNAIRPDADIAYRNAGISIIKNQYVEFEVYKQNKWNRI